jgi:predicted lactoylglutathione lyase
MQPRIGILTLAVNNLERSLGFYRGDGYAGYFADPDGHLWEVLFTPRWNGTLPQRETSRNRFTISRA